MGLREKLNLQTNKNLKEGFIQNLSNEELLALQRSTRRSKAAAMTGITANGVISLGNPVFLGGAMVNSWQGTVSSINRHRVKKEIEERKKKDESMQHLLDAKDKPIKDIATGVAIKTALTAVTLGVVGAETALDNTINVGTAVQEHFLGATDTIAQPDIPGPSPDALLHAHPNPEEFAIEHPDGAIADGAIHNFIGAAGDNVAQHISEATGNVISQDSSWLQLDYLHDIYGASQADLAAQTGIVGVQAELLQWPVMAVEVAIDEELKRRHEEEARKLLTRR